MSRPRHERPALPWAASSRLRVAAALLALAGAAAAGGCVAPATGAADSPAPADGDPDAERAEAGADGARTEEDGAGFGTLRQDDITLSFRSGELQLRVTPLEEGIIRLTSPDTYVRLANLSRSHRVRAESLGAVRDPSLFLVSVYSEAPHTAFEPQDLTVTSLGRRFRAVTIQPVTPEWGTRWLEQRQTRMAVYVFEGGVDLESDLQVEYGLAREDGWSRMLPRINAERARVRARGGREP